MKPTRQRILDYLENHRTVTADDLSRALQVTAADIRYHLSVIVEEKKVERINVRPGNGRGRPAGLYSLAQSIKEEPLTPLTDALLNVLFVFNSMEMQQNFMVQLVNHLARQSEVSKSTTGTSLTKRILRAILRFNDLGYQARWEAHAVSPRIILGNCPYNAILNNHPELCQMDALLLENLLKTPVRQIVRKESCSYGVNQCVFVIEIRAEPNNFLYCG